MSTILQPTKFAGSNVVFAENQKEYLPLPAFRNISNQGEVVTCWRISRWARIKLLFTGRIWLSMWTFNHPLTPVLISTKREDVLEVTVNNGIVTAEIPK